jgi:large subunit ribosomal protein L18
VKNTSEAARQKRHARIRRRVSGSPARPRMCIFRSDRHIYVQIVDDTTGKVLASASSLSKEFREQGLKGAGVAGAKAVGALIAQRAGEQAIAQVVFDRAGFIYHGRVKALADAAREKGLKF